MKLRNLNLKKVVVVQFLLIGLLLGSLIYVIASPNGTFTISPGVYPGAPSYTIWEDGGTYYAKDAYGALTFGTNANQISQNVINALPSGGMIFYKRGNYTFDSPLSITTNAIKIIGEEWGSTILKYTGTGAFITVGDGTNAIWKVTIKSLTLDGDGRETAIHAKAPAQCVFEDLYLEDWSTGYGILIDTNPVSSHRNWIKHVRMLRVKIGISINGTNNSNDNVIVGGSIVGWETKPSGTIGLEIKKGDTLRAYGLAIEDYDTGVYIKTNNHQFYGLRIETTNTGINLTSSSSNNLFFGGSISNSVTKVANAGSGNRFEFMGVTTNYGGGNYANDDWIAHGLDGTPTYITIAPSLPVYDGVGVVAGYYNQNATHFQVRLFWTNGTAITTARWLDWYAEYQP
jgi:hypothetical protein